LWLGEWLPQLLRTGPEPAIYGVPGRNGKAWANANS
jgi:hypothetical protein